jgi:integrase
MLAYLDGPSKQKRSQERDEFSAKRLFPFFQGRELGSISAADVRGYIALRQADGVAPATINKEMGLFRTALNWARKELEWEIPNPFNGRKLKEPEGRIRWITREEAKRLLETAKSEQKAPHLVDFIRLGLNTGMRSGEMLGLEWSRVDLNANLLYLGAEHQKNGKLGSIPLNREAREAILARASSRAVNCPASPWVFTNKDGERMLSIKKSFKSACKRAGLEDFHPHDLRHTCATWLVQAKVPIREVAELLRHSDIRITMRYAHLAPEDVRAAVSALDVDGEWSRNGHVVNLTVSENRV